MTELWQSEGRHEFVAPTGVLHAIKQAWPAFRGFQQHDSQEFLRCFMDQLHKELMEPVRDNDDDEETSDESDYESADSDNNDSNRSNKRQKTENKTVQYRCVLTSDWMTQSNSNLWLVDRSILTDIFDGALQSSVQCLTCNNVSKSKETFQDLSLPIPSSDSVNNKAEEGWVSWAWWWISSKYNTDWLTQYHTHFWSVDTLSYSLLIGWHNIILTSDWMTHGYTGLGLIGLVIDIKLSK